MCGFPHHHSAGNWHDSIHDTEMMVSPFSSLTLSLKLISLLHFPKAGQFNFFELLVYIGSALSYFGLVRESFICCGSQGGERWFLERRFLQKAESPTSAWCLFPGSIVCWFPHHVIHLSLLKIKPSEGILLQEEVWISARAQMGKYQSCPPLSIFELDYHSVFYVGLPLKSVQKFQEAQNAVGEKVLKLGKW